MNLLVLTACAVAFAVTPAAAEEPSSPAGALARGAATVEIVTFASKALAAVKVVRGIAAPARPRQSVEILAFGRGLGDAVAVVRGGSDLGEWPKRLSDRLRRANPERSETVTFANPQQPSVTVVRGPSRGAPELGLFAPAGGAELDRVAFAVDGVESSHGADPRMWRFEPGGPQGPMQVSQAAAIDVGGGNRFDLGENRVLGRAYLALMYQRYGNWPDAIAAYNWGPGNLDLWINAGGARDRLPPEVQHYVERVLRDALVQAAALSNAAPPLRDVSAVRGGGL